MVIVPSTAVETMGRGAMSGLTASDRILGAEDRDPDAEPEGDEGKDGCAVDRGAPDPAGRTARDGGDLTGAVSQPAAAL
jgi:hypothetical protein